MSWAYPILGNSHSNQNLTNLQIKTWINQNRFECERSIFVFSVLHVKLFSFALYVYVKSDHINFCRPIATMVQTSEHVWVEKYRFSMYYLTTCNTKYF